MGKKQLKLPTLLIVLFTLIPRHPPGNEAEFCPNYTWLVAKVLWPGTEQDHTALPGSTASHMGECTQTSKLC